MKNIFVLIFIFITLKEIIPQKINYFPLSIGNEYQYYDYYNNYFYFKIEKDSIFPNGKYYLYYPLGLGYCRRDSLGNVYSGSKPFFLGGKPDEYLFFKADADLNEIWKVAWDYNPVIDTGYAQCIFSDSIYIFGKNRKTKGVKIFDDSYNYFYIYYTEDVGIVQVHVDEDLSGSKLNYAKIDSVIYGVLSGINDKIEQLQNFIVYQNYPNPFNSTTLIKIQFPINSPESTYKFLIFNVLGEKIYEKEYPIGNSTIRIDSDLLRLTSGVYFYTI